MDGFQNLSLFRLLPVKDITLVSIHKEVEQFKKTEVDCNSLLKVIY